MTDWCWLVGGGQMSIPMAVEIKRRGYKLLLTDLDPHCPCRPLADHFGPVSVYGIEANLAYAQYGLHVTPKAVLTAGTDAGVEVAAIAEYFGLPGVGVEVAKRVHSKAAIRLLNFDHPRYALGTFEIDNQSGKPYVVTPTAIAPVPIWLECNGWNTYPCVVKADNASGSRGFSVVNTADELPEAIAKAIQANRGTSQVVIEELLQPKDVMPGLKDYHTAEIALDFFVENGQVVWVNGALRLFWKDRPGIEAGHFNPYVPDFLVIEQVQQAAEKLGVTFGPLKADFMKDERYGWVLQEMAVRLSGGFDHGFTCPLATGKDITGALLDIALGQPLDRKKLVDKKGRVACCLAPVHRPGKISGWEPTFNHPEYPIGLVSKDLTEIIFYRTQTEIKPLESNADRPVFLIADGANHKEAYEAARGLAERVRPVYD